MSDNIKLSDFFTRPQANEGIKLPLALPDGTETEHWIRIRSVDSDEFRKANRELQREMFEMPDGVDVEAEYDKRKLRLLSSLIVSWSLTEECNEANKELALKEAPHIADEINRISAKRSFFAKKKRTSSSESSNDSSSSTSQSQDQKE